ncbi:uncharacterized protein LOC121646080 [Melanotaenia boesemani]|uniref:uncharacterized protein LOC121646080 n=1 Tax=Melanotaenia boesemani TaxID=1250792 RepID=UPI001C04003B|nr:uncharacterized protein LOC121646080 [Melanotaenia boesemani]
MQLSCKQCTFSVYAEFNRIASTNLESDFFDSLDRFTPRFFTIFKSKKGSVGDKLAEIVQQIDSARQDVTALRTLVLRGLPILLGDDPSDFYNTAFVSNCSEAWAKVTVGLVTIINEDAPVSSDPLHLNPLSTGIILEGAPAMCLAFLDFPQSSWEQEIQAQGLIPGNETETEVDMEEILLLLLLMRSRRRRRSKVRRTWVRSWLQKRTGQGVYANLLQEMRLEDPESFRQYHRLDRESFGRVLEMVGPSIRKVDTTMRQSISPGERLAITRRFLATGETFRSLAFQFRIGERTVSNIVDETCQALYSTMREQYMKVPTTTGEWMEIAKELKERWILVASEQLMANTLPSNSQKTVVQSTSTTNISSVQGVFDSLAWAGLGWPGPVVITLSAGYP